ncbi:hypothetical protein GOBAR_AA00532 [Gossypium barbadense]|uniref:Rho-GAP domain-containing protein n=1 Tax=Gossypium barbadense TaxID=3634 RepID=A0A2P5YWR5_GOSBA|nr:hypothetical protein GOBAR_AA00532 [Gossypium barbadense]
MTAPVMLTKGGGCGGGGSGKKRGAKNSVEEQQQNQISVATLLLAALRKSMVSCRVDGEDEALHSAVNNMEIGWPTNVRHRECVWGLSGINAMLIGSKREQRPHYTVADAEAALFTRRALGIFRINPENSQEELVRDQLNRGIVPDNIDVHCLAGLIKAWFRELPAGVLDGLSPEQVLHCDNEEESVELVKQLKPTEAGLLNWAVDLMADVVEEEETNKMNARNIAMVFAPNMTQMSDPLTAMMHAVQVMNLLKTLIMKTLREREETASSSHSFDHHTDEEFDCRSLDEMDMSCEGPISDYDNSLYGNYNGDDEEDGVEAFGEIEECFLRQPDDENNKDATYSFLEKPSDESHTSTPPGSWTGCNLESSISFTDSKNENSGSTTSDGKDNDGVDMIDKLVESTTLNVI